MTSESIWEGRLAGSRKTILERTKANQAEKAEQTATVNDRAEYRPSPMPQEHATLLRSKSD